MKLGSLWTSRASCHAFICTLATLSPARDLLGL